MKAKQLNRSGASQAVLAKGLVKLRLTALAMATAMVAPLVFVASMGAPSNAQAACGECFSTLNAVKTAEANIMATIQANTNSILAGIQLSTFKIITAIESSTGSLVGANEKSMAGGRELEQAGLNYDAALKTTETLAKAQEKFTAPEAQAFKSCELLSQAQQANSASDNAKLEAKVMTAALSKRNAYTANSSKAAKDVLDDYKKNYCSKADIERGRECTEAPILMQAASVRADILLAPAAKKTYSEAESKAAESFITMVTNPVPVEALPIGMEKKPGADRFILEQMNANAQMNVAQHSLAQIKAAMTAPAAGAGNVNAAGISGSLSVVGLMHEFVMSKFGNPEYAKTLAGMGESGMLKELNMQMAFNNWIEFQSYEQTERIEALQATMLASAARERAERQLAMARGMVGK